MENKEAVRIAEIISERKKAHRYYSENSPVYRAFVEMEQKTYSAGYLDKKYKELIAIGISIHINCESCLEWHIHEALKASAIKEEILEAIGVGIEMGGGPATVSARFAMHVLDYYTGKMEGRQEGNTG